MANGKETRLFRALHLSHSIHYIMKHYQSACLHISSSSPDMLEVRGWTYEGCGTTFWTISDKRIQDRRNMHTPMLCLGHCESFSHKLAHHLQCAMPVSFDAPLYFVSNLTVSFQRELFPHHLHWNSITPPDLPHIFDIRCLYAPIHN